MSRPSAMPWSARSALLAALLLPAALAAQADGAEQNRVCWQCHAETDGSMTFADGVEVSIALDIAASELGRGGQYRPLVLERGPVADVGC